MATYAFVDLFAGCGGLSLGLALAGLQGQFVVERDPMAFETFSENFLGSRKVPVMKFQWPSWLEQRAWGIDEILVAHQERLRGLQGKVAVLAGGPPCQGFSFAGRRQEDDPRNKLFEKYVQMVDMIKPSALVLENVPGMKVAHCSKMRGEAQCGSAAESYYEKLMKSLENIGYQVRGHTVDASHFGVPQRRSRLIVMGLRNDVAASLEGGIDRVFELLEEKRLEQLSELGLPRSISAKDAISDLRVNSRLLKPCNDPYSPPGYYEAVYTGPSSAYQKLMHRHCRKDTMDSMRLTKHGDEVRKRFEQILKECALGVIMSKSNRERFGLKKHRIHPMSPSEPAPTLTTLPDDVLHYAEPRILTVRESARLQSFPDWFRFRGKYTTGGSVRTKECPRYTQVGNAVPPFLARAIGLAITAALEEANNMRGKSRRTGKRAAHGEPAIA